jgi:hypothetical protein
MTVCIVPVKNFESQKCRLSHISEDRIFAFNVSVFHFLMGDFGFFKTTAGLTRMNQKKGSFRILTKTLLYGRRRRRN